MLGQMAPYLLFGFVMAGLLSVWISAAWVERHLGGRGFKAVVKGALFGVPLPLCSCSVIPVSVSMHRKGAGRAATTAFLLATPQTGADCIAAMYAVLGPVFAIFSPIMAFLTGLFGGTLIRFFEGREERASGAEATASCVEEGGGCGAAFKPPARGSLWSGLRYGLTVLPRDIGAALMAGVLIAGAMTAFIPRGSLEPYIGGGLFSILLLMAAGVPVYVCATASIPIAAGLIHLGASPGAALAFLIAGPATNAATITTLWKVLGRRSAMLYMVTVAMSAIGFGLLLNGLVTVTGSRVPDLGGHVHGGEAAAIRSDLWAILLLGVLAVSYIVTWRQKITARAEEAATVTPTDQRVELAVSGMTCEHCANIVRKTLADQPGISSTEVDVDKGRVVVTGQTLNPESLVEMISSLGYSARLANAP